MICRSLQIKPDGYMCYYINKVWSRDHAYHTSCHLQWRKYSEIFRASFNWLSFVRKQFAIWYYDEILGAITLTKIFIILEALSFLCSHFNLNNAVHHNIIFLKITPQSTSQWYCMYHQYLFHSDHFQVRCSNVSANTDYYKANFSRYWPSA